MAAEEGFKVATGYVALVVADEDFQAQVEEAITAACEQAGKDGGAALTEQITAHVEESSAELGAPLVEAISQAGAEAGALFDEELVPEVEAAVQEMNALIVEELAQAGAEGGAAMGARISELLRLGLDEEAQALMDQLPSVLEPAGSAAGSAMGDAAGAALDDSLTSQAQATVAALSGRVEADAEAGGAATGDAYAGAFAAALRSGNFSFAQLMGLDSGQMEELAAELAAETAAAEVPAMQEVGGEVGAAFTVAFENYVSAHLVDAAVLPWASGALDAPFVTAGDQAGAAFSASFSRAASRSIGVANISGVLGPEFDKLIGGSGSAASELEKTSTAAKDTQGSMGGLAGIMNGPLMQGIYGLSAIAFLPMALGQLAPMISAMFDSTVASVSDFTTAVSQDSNAVGDNTAATIQNMLVKSGLNSLTQTLGVSQAQLIEYAAGESDAQNAVTNAYNAKYQALQRAAEASTVGQDANDGQMTQAQKQLAQLQDQKASLDQVTTAVQQAITTDQQNTEALLEAEKTTAIFNATMDDMHTKMLAQAQSSAQNTVATLGYTDAQSSLNRTLVDTVDSFNVANAKGSAYAAVLAALGPNLASSAQYAGLFQQALDALQPQIQAQASNAATSTLATLNLGDQQTALSQQLYNSVDAYSQANAQAAAYTTALAALDPRTVSVAQYTMLLQGGLDALQPKMQAQTSSTALSAVAALNLGDQQSALNLQLYNSVDAYSQANALAGAYSTVLAALGPHTVSTAQYTVLLQGALDSLAPKMAAQASSAALSAVSALQLGDQQYGLNLQLYNAVDAYSQAAAQASGYSAVLTALDGTTQTMLGSEAAFIIAVDGVSKVAKASGTSLDINTLAGAQNIQTFTQIAQAADKAAVSIYQNDVQTGNATHAYQDANAKLGLEKEAFIAAAEKAGFNATQVKALADELFKLPPDIHVGADITPALSELNTLLGQIDDSQGYVQVYATPGNQAGGHALLPDTAHRALGGPAQAGQPLVVGDGGRPEVFVPQSDGWIYPSIDDGQQALSGGGVTVHQHFYGTAWPSVEQSVAMNRELAIAVGAIG